MLRIVRMSKEKEFKNLNRFKLLQAYKREYPELTDEKKLENILTAFNINSSKVLNPQNMNHYVTMCRGYAEHEYLGWDPTLTLDKIKSLITVESTSPYRLLKHDYRDAVFAILYSNTKSEFITTH